jgi:hypothetical protein
VDRVRLPRILLSMKLVEKSLKSAEKKMNRFTNVLTALQYYYVSLKLDLGSDSSPFDVNRGSIYLAIDLLSGLH